MSDLSKSHVEFKKLKEVCRIANGRDHKHLKNGPYPVYGSGGIMRYAEEYLYTKPSVLIPRKGSLSNIFFVNEPFWVVDTIFYTIISTDIIDPRFFYHSILNLKVEKLNIAGGVPSLTKAVLDEVMIPVLPMETQKSIAEKLDAFTILKAELEAELEARVKQYQYYRDLLLSFPEKPASQPDRQTDRQTDRQA